MKHGIDFVEAQKIWLNSRRVQFPVPFPSEDRSVVIGKIDGKHWTPVTTEGDDRSFLVEPVVCGPHGENISIPMVLARGV